MKKLLIMILAAVFLAAPLAGPARAEKVDFGQVTCAHFLEFDEETVAYFYFWLDGYVSAKTGNTVLDTSAVEADLMKLFEFCQANPATTMLNALGK